MRLVLRYAVAIGLCLLCLGPALADIDDSRAWFEGLAEESRVRVETDLLFLGHFSGIPDATFDGDTHAALVAFQRAENAEETGVLSQPQRQALMRRGSAASTRFGFADTRDGAAVADLPLPALATEQVSTGTGTSYSSADGEFSIETIRIALGAGGFPGLFDALTVSDEERQVLDMEYAGDRFGIMGKVGDYEYRTFVRLDGDTAVGFTVAWGSVYADDGPVIAAYIAARFVPAAVPGNAPKVAAVPETAGHGAFSLPPDQPELIVLNAEITSMTAVEFDGALAARPDARIVALNSPGGAVDSAIAMALKIRRLGLDTYVPAGMGCYSACAFMFFAGADRSARGELGVHQISSEVADLVFAQATLGDVLDALETFGVAQTVISRMLRTPPDDMYVFTPEEIETLGINHGEPIDVAVAVAPPAVPSTETSGAAFVELASLSTHEAATRSRDYFAGRWGAIFGDAVPRVDIGDIGATGAVYRVRVPTSSVERANTICAAIRADGGGCFISGGT